MSGHGGARGDLDAAPAVLSRERRVLVTIEGTAREVLRTGLPDMLRVRPEGSPVTVLVDPDAPGVTVETIAPPRVWTDGDVIHDTDDGETFTRDGGRWLSSHAAVSRVSDATVDRWLTEDGWLILRYQAGESA